LILVGQGQARLHLKFNDPWSHEWGPVQSTAFEISSFGTSVAGAKTFNLGAAHLALVSAGRRDKKIANAKPRLADEREDLFVDLPSPLAKVASEAMKEQ